MESSSIAKIIQTLADIHRCQHKALVKLCAEQDQRFQSLLQAQAEDLQVLRSLVQLMSTPVAAAAALHHLTLAKMCLHYDPEAFIELFERDMEACAWPAM